MNKIIKARQKIKNHLKNNGHDTCFEVDHKLVRYWWHVLNHAVFDGQLTPPKRIICKNFREDTLGWCQQYMLNTNVRMGFRRHFTNRRVFLTVLVHEMVHQHELATRNKMSHGKYFYAWRDKIKSTIGLPLNKLIDIDID